MLGERVAMAVELTVETQNTGLSLNTQAQKLMTRMHHVSLSVFYTELACMHCMGVHVHSCMHDHV